MLYLPSRSTKNLRLSQTQEGKKLAKKLGLFLPYRYESSFLELEAGKKNPQKLISVGRDMDALGKELEGNRVNLDTGIQDQAQWSECGGVCEGFQNWDQCLRLLQNFFSSSIGVITNG